MSDWADATREKPKRSNGDDKAGPWKEFTPDVLKLIIDLIHEYERDTGREITAPELADKLEHPGS